MGCLMKKIWKIEAIKFIYIGCGTLARDCECKNEDIIGFNEFPTFTSNLGNRYLVEKHRN